MSYSITILGGPVSEFGARADAAFAAAVSVPAEQRAAATKGIAAAKAIIASGVFDADGVLGATSVSGHGHTEGTGQTSFSFYGYQVDPQPV